jgi:hypothetical protein
MGFLFFGGLLVFLPGWRNLLAHQFPASRSAAFENGLFSRGKTHGPVVGSSRRQHSVEVAPAPARPMNGGLAAPVPPSLYAGA